MIRIFTLIILGLLVVVSPVVSYEIVTIDQGRGPLDVFLPDDAGEGEDLALLVQLHGYGSSGGSLEAYLRFVSLVDEYRLIYLYPEGTVDSVGARFWNATDACCDFDNTEIDDSAYLRSLIDELIASYSVNPARVFFIGHSNGGFMGYRMACEHGGVVTGVVSLAGASFFDPAECQPPAPVHILQVHGTADGGLLYEGGCFTADDESCYPGAIEMVEHWAAKNGCDPQGDTSLPPMDLTFLGPGDETSILRFRAGCMPGGSAELWSVEGGVHAPMFNADFARTVLDHLYELTPALIAPRRPTGRCKP